MGRASKGGRGALLVLLLVAEEDGVAPPRDKGSSSASTITPCERTGGGKDALSWHTCTTCQMYKPIARQAAAPSSRALP
eukprot:1158152-Pelagomonas_calceolata.AAC.1